MSLQAAVGDVARMGGERAQARGSIYGLLALGFRPPGQGFSEVLRDASALDELQHATGTLSLFPLQASLRQFEAAVSRLASDPAQEESLALEHTRLFVGPGPLAAPPYASVYSDPRGQVMGEAALEALRHYHEAGMCLSPAARELPDHVALELEFLASLCEQEASAWGRTDTVDALYLLTRQVAFLSQHLLAWIPGFSTRLAASTRCELYLALAHLVEDYARLDCDQASSLAALLMVDDRSKAGA